MSPASRIAVAMAVLAVNCGPTKASGVPAKLQVTGPVQLVGIGSTAQWTVREQQSDYAVTDVPGAVTWSSSDPKVASVSSNGLITAVSVGATTITASYQSLSAYQTLRVMELTQVGLVVTTNLTFTDIGQTAQLSAAVRYSNNTTQDVSAQTAWASSDPSVVTVTPSGALTVVSVGAATITGHYGDLSLTSVATVLPTGTFAVSGRVRLPGAGLSALLGVPDFTVTNLDFGNTTLSDSRGQYVIGGAKNGTVLRFEKSGFETADLVVSGPNENPTVQKLIRITAGETVSTTVFENDIRYDPDSSFQCANCRLVRVVIATAGTLHVQINWSANVNEALWVNGVTFGPTGARELVADVPVDAGESLLYVRSGSFNFVTVTIKTSLSVPPGPSHWE